MLMLLKFVTGYLPQGISFVLFICAFCKEKVSIKKYWISSAIMVVSILLIRQLKINFGIHTLLNIVVLVALCYGYIHLPLKKTVIGCLSVTVFQLILEIVNVVVLTLIYGQERFSQLTLDDAFMTYTAIPPVFVFLLFAIIFYFVRTKRVKDKGQNDGTAD